MNKKWNRTRTLAIASLVLLAALPLSSSQGPPDTVAGALADVPYEAAAGLAEMEWPEVVAAGPDPPDQPNATHRVQELAGGTEGIMADPTAALGSVADTAGSVDPAALANGPFPLAVEPEDVVDPAERRAESLPERDLAGDIGGSVPAGQSPCASSTAHADAAPNPAAGALALRASHPCVDLAAKCQVQAAPDGELSLSEGIGAADCQSAAQSPCSRPGGETGAPDREAFERCAGVEVDRLGNLFPAPPASGGVLEAAGSRVLYCGRLASWYDEVIYMQPGDSPYWGTSASEVIIGTSADDVIIGQDGDDCILGKGGNDLLIGGGGNDRIKGGSGDDALYGDPGDDELDGNAGNDFLYGDHYSSSDEGNDHLDGGPGDDTLYGFGGDDTLLGGWGKDNLFGDRGPWGFTYHGYGDDHLDGGANDDFLYGDSGSDKILGGWGEDHLYGDRGPDGTVEPAAGNDDMDGGNDYDQLFGDAGDDDMDGGWGDDYMEGNEGNDDMRGQAGWDTIHGGPGDDDIQGDDGEDTIYGNDGHDTIRGGGKRDWIHGGSGNDHIWGNAGDDIMDGGPGQDTMEGGDGNDYVRGGADHDVLRGNSGDDTIWGDTTAADWDGAWDTIEGGLGGDFIYGQGGGDWIDAGWGDDFVNAGDGNDVVYGRAGADTLWGGCGDDDIYGGDWSADTIFGGYDGWDCGGNDWAHGGAGHRTLWHNHCTGVEAFKTVWVAAWPPWNSGQRPTCHAH